MKKPRTLLGKFLFILPITIVLDVSFNLTGFKEVVVEVFAHPASLWALILILAHWAVDAFIFALYFISHFFDSFPRRKEMKADAHVLCGFPA